MRLPNLHLRVPRPSFEHFPRIGGRFILYGVYTLVLFFVFLIANFPYNVVVQGALDSIDLGPVELDVRETRFAWWNGCELRDVLLTRANADLEEFPLLESRSLFVRPGLSGLLGGKLSSVHVKGAMYNGRVDANWATNKGRQRVTLRLKSIQIGRHPLLMDRFVEGDIAGWLSGLLSVEPRGGGISGIEAAGELVLSEGRVIGAVVRSGSESPEFTVPDLNRCVADAKFGMSGGRAEIQEFNLNCDELTLTLSGQITVHDNVSSSRLSIQMTANPGPNASDEWKTLAALIPCGLRGTINSPRAQSCSGRSAGRGRRR